MVFYSHLRQEVNIEINFFYVGIVIQAAAMIGIALGGGSVFMIVIMIACYNIGNQFAGESIYKVWTQESFRYQQEHLCRALLMDFQDFAVVCLR